MLLNFCYSIDNMCVFYRYEVGPQPFSHSEIASLTISDWLAGQCGGTPENCGLSASQFQCPKTLWIISLIPEDAVVVYIHLHVHLCMKYTVCYSELSDYKNDTGT